MAGRALAFSDPEMVRLAREEFVPVAADDWYQRRREDAEGEFFRSVADQGPRKGQGGSTRQGIYCLTASGRLLAYRNAADPQVMIDVLREALTAWNKLPRGERAAGSIEVPPLNAEDLDERYARAPPEGGLILKVHARTLEQDEAGEYRACSGDETGYGGQAASTDHLWISEEEWRSLIPAKPRPNDAFEMPAAIAHRIARYHLLDNTRGEPSFWSREEIRSLRISLRVERADDAEVLLRMEGGVLLSTDERPAAAERGYEAALSGHIRYDIGRDAISEFEVLVLGEHWGEGPFTGGARPGRTPLGVAFLLTPGEHPTDRIAPQGMRDRWEYLATGQ